ncbi:YdcF family protein [Dermacoccaceae bacterium W4C1]
MYALRRRSRPVVGVIVLGSRIVDGRVPPLLAARLERAMQVHRLHADQGWAAPLLVPSGGQGADEAEPEGSAMARWLIEHGVPADDVLAETEAETTEQNLRLGREVIRENRGEGRIAVVTNDYHAFRAALLSHRIGLGADVLGARTASYFRPSAYLREFVAVLRMHLRWHLVVVVALIAGCVALTVEALRGL